MRGALAPRGAPGSASPSSAISSRRTAVASRRRVRSEGARPWVCGCRRELSARLATLYLSGRLAGCDAFFLCGVCRDIPLPVRTLRLDLHAVTALDEGAMDAIRALVRYWRETRNGNFRLAFATERAIERIIEQ